MPTWEQQLQYSVCEAFMESSNSSSFCFKQSKYNVTVSEVIQQLLDNNNAG